jgi:hypothetical protein
MRPHSMRRILAPSWRAAQRIFERDAHRGIAIMGALSRIQHRDAHRHAGP